MSTRFGTPVAPRPVAAPARLTATALDAAAVALSVALIIGMVGSLVFFLIIAFYRGEYDARLMYILGLFTAATVLIARIAIDSGRAYANAFAIPLAVVAILALGRFVSIGGPLAALSWPINIGLLAIAWLLADRITYDCTWIPERKRSVQQGLLQSLGLLASDKPSGGSGGKRAHNPGVWVLYFALLAFPLFGLGQLVIPAGGQRTAAFGLLVSYLACALSLLVLTSLVGMRRYLRQRGVNMPEELSLQWLSVGLGSVLIILLLCLVLPLPGRSLGLVGVPDGWWDAPERLGSHRWGWGDEAAPMAADAPAAGTEGERPAGPQASGKGPGGENGSGNPNASNPGANEPAVGEPRGGQQAAGKEAAGKEAAGKEAVGKEGQGEAGREPPDKAGAGNDSEGNAPNGNAPNGNDPGGNDSGSNDSGSNDPGGNDSESNDPAGDAGQSAAATTGQLPQLPPLGDAIRWLTMAVLALVVVAYVVTHPAEIARLGRELWMLLAGLLGWRRRSVGQAAAASQLPGSAATRLRPFSAFANPFASQLVGWEPAQVVRHSFAALEAWGAERGSPRDPQQTAVEYARQLGGQVPELGAAAVAAAHMLDQLMFANWQPRQEDIRPLQNLWRGLCPMPPTLNPK